MHSAPLFAGLLIALAGCAATTPILDAPPAPQPAQPLARLPEMLSPLEILEIVRESPLSYHIVPGDEGARSELGPYTERLISPYLRVREVGDTLELYEDTPPASIEGVFDQANEAYARRDFAGAVRLFEEAADAAPGYFKTWTYLGNSHFALQDLAEARVYFEKALALNPLDYQSHFFLADTHFYLGDLDLAVHHMTLAFVLNKNNEVLRKVLSRILAQAGLQLRDERLTIPVRIEQSAQDEVTIRVGQDPAWVAWGLCVACWSNEDACRKRTPGREDTLGVTMHRECLLHHAMTVEGMLRKREAVSDQSRRLHDAIADGYLDAIVLWEIVASSDPSIVLMLSEGERHKIARYIEAYVYEPLKAPRQPVGPPEGEMI